MIQIKKWAMILILISMVLSSINQSYQIWRIQYLKGTIYELNIELEDCQQHLKH